MTASSRGRPRSQVARLAVLTATNTLLIQHGYEHLSIRAIADEAGVGKQTIYRWWNSKAEIVAEAAINGAVPIESTVPAVTPSLSADLLRLVEWFTDAANGPGGTALIRALASASAANESLGAQLWDKFAQPARSAITDRLSAAVSSGEVRPDIDITVAADAVIGVLLFQVLSRQPIDTMRMNSLIEIVLEGISTGVNAAESTHHTDHA